MRRFHINVVDFGLLLVLLVAIGCNERSSSPALMPVEHLSSALEKAFSKAKPELKDFAKEIGSSLQTQDYPKAFLGLQALSTSPGLTREQQSITSRGMLTVNSLLQSAQAKGDPKADAALKYYRSNK